MAFTLPNLADAALADQAQPDKVDFDIIVFGSRGTGATSGCAVTTTGTGNGSVTVASGVIRVSDQLYTVAGNTVAVTANSSGNPRYDLITVGSSGTAVATAGTAAPAPVFPAIPAGSVVLAAVRVPNGHTTGTTIPANTIIDKRVLVPATMAAPANNTAYYSIVAPDDSRATLRIYGGTGGGGNFQILEILDYLGAPIAVVNTAGGLWVNDFIKTAYSVLGPENFNADIYGTIWQGNRASFAFGGPPGNMLSFANACQENHQAARNATLGNWSAVGGCTIATRDLGVPPNSPTRLRSAIRITATGTTPWISQPGGVFALSGITAGRPLSGVAWMKSGTAAAARTFNVRFTFYNSGGTAVGADVNGTGVAVPNTGVWTKLSLDGTVVPATATLVAIQIIGTVVSGETFDVCGVGVMKDSQTGVFAPPFVFQDATTGGASPAGEGVALAGARWNRTDTPNTPGAREYTCTTGGAPNVQVWAPIDNSTLYKLYKDVVNSTTTMAGIAELTFPIEANATVTFEYNLLLTSAATTTGWQFGFTAPASPSRFYAECLYDTAATGTAGKTKDTIQSVTTFTLVTAAYVATANAIRVTISGQLNNGANAGDVVLQFKSEVAASAITLLKGSILNVT